NLFGSNPDADWAARALSGLPWQVTLSTTLNTGHARAASPNHLILPVLARDEEPQPTTQESMFNFVRLSSGGPARFPGPRSEIDIIADLFGRVGALRTTGIDPLHALDWPNMTETAGVRRMMADVVPGWEALSELDNGGEEFHISGRTFHTPAFATPDGKARFQQPDFTRPVGRPDQLRLMTIRSEGQFNTVVYEEEDLYRGPRQRDVVLLHPLDIAERGLTDGQRVRVEGPGGRMPHQRVFAFDRIRPGNAAMYFPEANQLLDRRVDADSRTPAFKGSWITLLP
ncbi:MAG: histidine kinase, partial [Bacteroidetes bacterium]|nr:histidine kinase [Bacteroidota bacterium]